jgi:hypothetical protein
MTDGPSIPAGSGIDSSVPHSARIWNYWLGGKDNYEADREAGDQFLAFYPQQRDKALACRQFLIRTVGHLAAEAGVRQFLDVGTGLPTMQNTHEVAQGVAPDSKIVYVDNDPLVLAHARALLANTTSEGETVYVDADLHEPDAILDAAAASLDFDRPVALLLFGVLGHVEDYDEAVSIVRRLQARLPSGSYFVQCDGTPTSEAYVQAIESYRNSGGVPYNLRTEEQIARYYEGLELVEPGLVPIPQWRQDPVFARVPAEVDQFGGVGRKP